MTNPETREKAAASQRKAYLITQPERVARLKRLAEDFTLIGGELAIVASRAEAELNERRKEDEKTQTKERG